jgi:hypothetical protein
MMTRRDVLRHAASMHPVTLHPLTLAAAGLAVLLLGAGVAFWLARGTGGPAGSGGGDDESGYVPDPQLAAFFGEPLAIMDHGSFGEDDASVRSTGVGGDPAAQLRVRYPADSASRLAARDDDAENGGFQVYLARNKGPVDEAWLSYRLRFPAGFDFVKGGKLPGLFGGTSTSGRHIPDGTNGFSTRYMWRAKGAGEVYAYLPTSREHGTSLGRGAWHWPTGRWVRVVQHVRLNDPGAADGVIDVWLDGKKVYGATGLRFRSTGTLKIDGVFFSTFFGGGDRSWASPRDQYADFADVRLSTRVPEPE